MSHARCVAGIAVEFFDRTYAVHQLEWAMRSTVYYAGLLHDVAHSQGRKKHHKRGRDIILNTPIHELTRTQRRLIAASTLFHRKKWKPKKRLNMFGYKQLESRLKPIALWIASIVRIADGLDHSRTQSSIVHHITVGEDHIVHVGVMGELKKKDVKKAHKKADLWRYISEHSLVIETSSRS